MRKDGVTVSDKELKFAEEYAACGNAIQAAIKAGYSEKTAQFASNWLNPRKPKKYKPEVADYVRKLSQASQEARILSVSDRQEILSDIARGGLQDADRIRAIDTLNKMTGEYITKIEGSMTAEINPFKGLTTEELKKLAGE